MLSPWECYTHSRRDAEEKVFSRKNTGEKEEKHRKAMFKLLSHEK